MSLRYVALVAMCVCASLFPTDGRAEDIPTFEHAYGQPAIAFEPYYGYSGGESVPIAVDAERIYIGSTQEVVLFSRDGTWTGFWPVSSAVRGVGGPPLPGREGRSMVGAVATSPWGWVYVADPWYSALHIYDSDGGFIGGWGGVGDGPYEFSVGQFPRAVCTGEDASVYVLSAGDALVEGGRIRRHTPTGTFVVAWDTPTAEYPFYCWPADIAAAAGGGVWLLNWTLAISGDVVYVVDARVHLYSPDGEEQANWTVPLDSLGIAVDPSGDVWVLVFPYRLERYAPDGTLVSSFEVDTPRATDIAVSSDSRLYVTAMDLIPGQCDYYENAAVYRIEVRDLEGDLLEAIGDYQDLLARGALVNPWSFAVTPDGDAYVKTPLFRADYNYVSHFAPDGQLLEAIQTDEWPIYSPAAQRVEFLQRAYDAAAADGSYYLLDATCEDSLASERHWTIAISKYSAGEEQVASYFVPGPVTDDQSWIRGRPSAATDADGNLVIAASFGGWYPEPYGAPGYGTLWVGTVTADGTLLSSWDDDSYGASATEAVAVDPAANVYVGGEGGVWKYSPAGVRMGRIGGWGGEGDQRDAPGSLVKWAQGLHLDSSGHLRVLDSGTDCYYERAANRILVFAYQPGPFPDVPYYWWAKDEIRAIADAGIALGYADGDYWPEREVTRDQMAVYIARALCHGDGNVPPGPDQASFYDVPPDHWAYKHVEYARSQDIVRGFGDGYFRPGAVVDRAQMAVFIARAMAGGDSAVPDLPCVEPIFPDVPCEFWARKHIEYARLHRVVRGYSDGCYHPEATCTRDQMAVYVSNAFELQEQALR